MSYGYTFNDVMFEPQYSDIQSRSEVRLDSKVGGLNLSLPIVSANMADITEENMVKAMHDSGGLGIMHRFMSVEENVEMFLKCKEMGIPNNKIGVSIGVGERDKERFTKLLEVGATNFCIDVAHGHHVSVKNMLEWIKTHKEYKIGKLTIIAGNVASVNGAYDLYKWGAHVIKVGVGPGCFIAGTKVMVEDGEKNIEDIEIGDMVLTHLGDYKEVTAITNRLESEKLIIINSIKCTDNHEFYVINSSDEGAVSDENIESYAQWVRADALTTDHRLLEVYGFADKKNLKKYDITPIATLSEESFDGTVYDITVEDHQSYTVNGRIAVHNSCCQTRENTGVGVPQLGILHAIREHFYEMNISDKCSIIADGGIKKTGDITKALVYADAIMVGGFLSGTSETPGHVYETMSGEFYKTMAGSASAEAKTKYGKEKEFVEGGIRQVPFRGHVKYVLQKAKENVQSGFSYSGARNIDELRSKAVLVKISSGGKKESKL
jgi:IMP dehydrogenase/GMP reductase